jgi:large subunit ribosomal protein L30
MSEMKKLKITQIRSVIDRPVDQKRTIEALGLGRPHYFTVKNDTPQIRGMVNKVKHLVTVEELTEE